MRLSRQNCGVEFRSLVVAALCTCALGCDEEASGSPLPPPELPDAPLPPQMPPGADPSGTPVPDAEPPSDNDDLLKFIDAEKRVANLRQGASARVHAGEDPKLVEQDFQKQAAKLVQDAGLAPSSFQTYSARMRTDPEFAKQVNALIAEKNLAKDAGRAEKNGPDTEEGSE